MNAPDPYIVRPFRRSDRSAVRAICAATAWMGEPAPLLAGDEWIWAEYWTRYFTDRQWRFCRVAEDRCDGRVVGYLTGTPDAAGFDAYAPFLLPGIVHRIIRRRVLRKAPARRAIRNLLASVLRGELELPPGVARQYPATFHFNLLARARRRGLGSRMLGIFLERMRELGVAGVHARVLSINRASTAALARAGFRPAGERPLWAFAHHQPGSMAIQTWIASLTSGRENG